MTVIIPFGVIMGLAWQGLRDQSPQHAAAIILSNFQLKRLLKMHNFNLVFSTQFSWPSEELQDNVLCLHFYTLVNE